MNLTKEELVRNMKRSRELLVTRLPDLLEYTDERILQAMQHGQTELKDAFRNRPSLVWGSDRIGEVALLQAMAIHYALVGFEVCFLGQEGYVVGWPITSIKVEE
jgi:hypothetical protein